MDLPRKMEKECFMEGHSGGDVRGKVCIYVMFCFCVGEDYV